jgi:hypothetical protein
MLLVGILNFKFRIVFWRLGDLKNELHFLKKATFTSHETAVTASMQEFYLRNYWTQCALVLFVACLSEVSNQAQAQLKVGKGRGARLQ